ncbi:hypothetical protein GCAAIG_03995 [Candidatus Electronema halotolerans]|jgi:hypothetical protein
MKTMLKLLFCAAALAFFIAACGPHNLIGQCGGNSPEGGTCSDTNQ